MTPTNTHKDVYTKKDVQTHRCVHKEVLWKFCEHLQKGLSYLNSSVGDRAKLPGLFQQGLQQAWVSLV